MNPRLQEAIEHNKLRLRQLQAKEDRPRVMAELRQKCSLRVADEDFLNIHETIELKDKVAGHLKQIEADPTDYRIIRSALPEFGLVWSAACSVPEVLILLSLAETILEGIRLRGADALRSLNALGSVVGEDFALITEAADAGVVREKDYYSNNYTHYPHGIYRLVIWGPICWD